MSLFINKTAIIDAGCNYSSKSYPSTFIEDTLKKSANTHPFHHDLGIRFVQRDISSYMLCCHEFGGNSDTILERVRPCTSESLLSFNAVDYNFSHETGDDNQTVMATPFEVIPLLYMLKTSIVNGKLSSLSLYGYGLGAANIIHALFFLQTQKQDLLLKKYGITQSDKLEILQSLGKGRILLDVPFKSIEELIDLRGPQETLLMYKKRSEDHQLPSPIDCLAKLSGLKLNFLVFFDTNNEVFSNRDDDLFANRLKEANKEGSTCIIQADNSGYAAHHPSLWEANRQMTSQ